ncbi:hypothetical protein OGAPHI_003747 [Ogataea philodendri]|uniref:Uncharacterized protein n=1 Tax=Ogataea philodendri TaxID=1378263 RepID=A0A9P8P5S3_9ASCO|nr:uncharacterized protein OGAPHI_003747 [Ogataea philodendri]KAH3665560.1 hypothetical protein OGAPHI_003747 [Ogataea philodendri]
MANRKQEDRLGVSVPELKSVGEAWMKYFKDISSYVSKIRAILSLYVRSMSSRTVKESGRPLTTLLSMESTFTKSGFRPCESDSRYCRSLSLSNGVSVPFWGSRINALESAVISRVS